MIATDRIATRRPARKRAGLLLCLALACAFDASAQSIPLRLNRAPATPAPAAPSEPVAPVNAGPVDASTDYLARMDADGDGRVSLAEYQDWLSYAFTRMDANGDGVLAPDELPGGRGRPGEGSRTAKRAWRVPYVRSSSLMDVFARVCASTFLTITAQAREWLPSPAGRLPGTTTDPAGTRP